MARACCLRGGAIQQKRGKKIWTLWKPSSVNISQVNLATLVDEKNPAPASVRAMVQIHNDPIKLLLTVQSITLKMCFVHKDCALRSSVAPLTLGSPFSHEINADVVHLRGRINSWAVKDGTQDSESHIGTFLATLSALPWYDNQG